MSGQASLLIGYLRDQPQVVVRVGGPDPALHAWKGGASLAQDPEFSQLCVTRCCETCSYSPPDTCSYFS